MSATDAQQRQVSTLVRLLGDQARACDGLAATADQKIAAMRASDVDALREAVALEAERLEQFQRHDALRRQLVTQIARAHGLGTARAAGLTIRQLADRFAGESGKRLESAGDGLRAALLRLNRRHRMAHMVADGVLQHLRVVFLAMTGAGDRETTYGATGGVPVCGGHRVIDAIG